MLVLCCLMGMFMEMVRIARGWRFMMIMAIEPFRVGVVMMHIV